MATAAATVDQAADLLQTMTLDVKTNQGSNGSEGKDKPLDAHKDAVKSSLQASAYASSEPATPYYYPAASTYFYGGYGGLSGWDEYSTYVSPNGSEAGYSDIYQHAYGYPYSSYPSSPVPGYGHDSQLYGSQHYQYNSPYYQQSTQKNSSHAVKHTPNGDMAASTGTDQLPIGADTSKVSTNAVNGVKSIKKSPVPLKLNQPSITSNGSYTRPAVRSSIYQSSAWGYDGSSAKSKMTQVKNQTTRPLTPMSGYSTTSSPSGMMNRMYPSGGIYGHTNSYRPGYWYGTHLYGTGLGAWSSLYGNKYRTARARSPGSYIYSNDSLDGLNELKRGPRNGLPKIQPSTASPISTDEKAQEPASNEKLDSSSTVDKESYNAADLLETYEHAKFFVIKSYSEDDVHKSVKYNVWASTPTGNKKLDAAFQDAKEKQGYCPVFLFFSVNTSGQFVGLAEMTGRVNFEKTVEYWQQDKWHGCFPVKWHIVKDIPNNMFKHIILENNENKPVTNSRDTQEVLLDQGLQMLRIFKEHICKTSILDDFSFYDTREKVMQERKAKQQQMLRKVGDEKPTVGAEAVAPEMEHQQLPAHPELNDNGVLAGGAGGLALDASSISVGLNDVALAV